MPVVREYSLKRNERKKLRGVLGPAICLSIVILSALAAWLLLASKEEALRQRAREEDYRSVMAFTEKVDATLNETLKVTDMARKIIKDGSDLSNENLNAVLEGAIASCRSASNALSDLSSQIPATTDESAGRFLRQGCVKLRLGISHQGDIFSDLKHPLEKDESKQERIDHLTWNSAKVDVIVQSALIDFEAAKKSVALE